METTFWIPGDDVAGLMNWFQLPIILQVLEGRMMMCLLYTLVGICP